MNNNSQLWEKFVVSKHKKIQNTINRKNCYSNSFSRAIKHFQYDEYVGTYPQVEI